MSRKRWQIRSWAQWRSDRNHLWVVDCRRYTWPWVTLKGQRSRSHFSMRIISGTALPNCTKFSRILLGLRGNYWAESSHVTTWLKVGVVCSVDINCIALTGQRRPGPYQPGWNSCCSHCVKFRSWDERLSSYNNERTRIKHNTMPSWFAWECITGWRPWAVGNSGKKRVDYHEPTM